MFLTVVVGFGACVTAGVGCSGGEGGGDIAVVSSTPVMVTVWGVFQLAVVKERVLN